MKRPTPPRSPASPSARALFHGICLSLLMGAAAAVADSAPPPTALAPIAGDAPASQARALHALFDRHWEWSARVFPEWASYRGDHRYGDRLTDVSAAAVAARDGEVSAFLAEARALETRDLSATDRVSLAMFIDALQRQLDVAAFPAARGMTLRALGGPQTQLADLLQVVPTTTVPQVQQILARFAAYPVRTDQEIDALRRSAAAGWIPTRDVLRRVLAQIDSQLPAEIDESPFFGPFKQMDKAPADSGRMALQAQARHAIATQVVPSLQRLRRLVTNELLPRAPLEGGLGRYPDGAAVYDMAVRHRTTTALTPAQIHAIGLRELTRLRGEMEGVMREVKFEGSFADFARYLNTDPRFFHTSAENLMTGYRDIAKRLDAEVPRLFAELPRAPYGVKAMPAHMGPNRAEYYNGPALDGTRSGTFYANALGYRTRPIWGMETLVAHEAVPGHHLQVARAAELRGLPGFRRSGFGYTAFSEGWALYAETLGFELGLYTDPYSRYGHLQWQAFRAARLVADTGLHALDWSRRQTIDFMIERTGVDRAFVESEVDRYVSDPGQALAYMIGKLKIDELRDRARDRLGAAFDLRRFHNAVIDQGPLPLSTLELSIDAWVAQQQATATSTARPPAAAP